MGLLTDFLGQLWQRYGIRLISQSGDDLPTGFVIGSGPWDPAGRYGTSDRGSGDDRRAKTRMESELTRWLSATSGAISVTR